MCEIILIASGSYAKRPIASRVLRKVGYKVIDAATEAGALRCAIGNEPHLIVLAGLGEGGPDVCRSIKDNPAAGGIPIVVMCSPRDRKYWSRECGVDLLLPESVAPRTLVSVIQLLLRSGSAARLKRELQSNVEELVRERERLTSCNQDLTGVVSLKAHDLLSPLCTISFVSAWISGEYGDRLGVNGREYFKLLEKSVERVMAVVNRLTIRSQASDRSKVA